MVASVTVIQTSSHVHAHVQYAVEELSCKKKEIVPLCLSSPWSDWYHLIIQSWRGSNFSAAYSSASSRKRKCSCLTKVSSIYYEHADFDVERYRGDDCITTQALALPVSTFT